MAQLDVKSGQPRKTRPNDACFEKDLYAQEDAEGSDNTVEALFSVVERHSAPAIRRLLADPLSQTPEDRETVSYYLAFQHMRGPVMLAQLGDMAESVGLATLAVHLEDAGKFRTFYVETINPAASDEVIEASRQSVRHQLQSGALRLANPKAEAIYLMLATADELAQEIHQLQWTLVSAGDDEFITCDRALAMHDPTPRFPWSGHAFRSSPDAQTTVPLAPESVLLLENGPARVGPVEVDSIDVRKINLRTYGWAERFIYGRNQAVVQHVRRQAKRFRHEVIRPRPMRQVVIADADPSDPTVGQEHVRRGWPRGLYVRGEDGRPQFVAYKVLEPGEAKLGQAALAGAEVGRRVIEAAVRDGLTTPDRLGGTPS